MLTTQVQRAEEARTLRYLLLTVPALSQPQRSPTTARYRIRPRQGYPPFGGVAEHDPAYPESLPGAPLVRYTYRRPVNCWRYMTAAIRRCALSI